MKAKCSECKHCEVDTDQEFMDGFPITPVYNVYWCVKLDEDIEDPYCLFECESFEPLVNNT